jgi:PTS system glucose-specific IIC component
VDIASPAEGEIVDISEVPDEAFAGRMVGDGFAIIPASNAIYSPVDGEVAVLIHTNHAVGLKSEEGLEVLIHIGIDTVELKGEGFTPNIKTGDKVNKGDLLITFDREFIEKKAKSMMIPVVVTNMDMVDSMEVFKGTKNIGDKAATVKIKGQ